jgi:hypothetical protein
VKRSRRSKKARRNHRYRARFDVWSGDTHGTLCVRQRAKCSAQNAFCGCAAHVGVGAHLFERSACFSFAKAQSAKSAKGLRVCLGTSGIDDAPVRSSVGMAKHETSRRAAFDDELPAMLCTMMRGAEDDDCIGIVIAALGAKVKMVQIK